MLTVAGYHGETTQTIIAINGAGCSADEMSGDFGLGSYTN